MKRFVLILLALFLLFSFGCKNNEIIDDNQKEDPKVDDGEIKEEENKSIPLEGIDFIIKNEDVFIGDKLEIEIILIPENTTDNVEYSFISSDEEIINSDLLCLKEGGTSIRIEVKDSDIYKEKEIIVKRKLNPNFNLKNDEIELCVGDIYKIEYDLIDTSEAPIFSTESNLIELKSCGEIYAKETGELVVKVQLFDIVKEIKVIINEKAPEPIDIINEVINSINIPNVIDCDIYLPTSINGVEIDWSSSDKYVMTDNGKTFYSDSVRRVTLYATFIYDDLYVDKNYYINVRPWNDEFKINKAIEDLDIPTIVSSNLSLSQTLNYGVTAIWTSTDTSVISNSGVVNLKEQPVDLIITLKAKAGDKEMERQFSVHTLAKKKMNLHYFVERANEFNKNNLNNLEFKEGKITLKDGEVYGYYDSDIYETLNFSELVASFAAVTSKTCTCELLVKVKVGDSWSKYFTYGIWGLGRNNLYYNQIDSIARMDTDEILVDTNNGCGYQYRIILRRDNANVSSPVLSLVAVTMRIADSSYKYDVDVSNLPDFVDYDVPKVNQNVVPTIGNSICSPTTSTMLLKWKGLDFSSYDQYENRYIANLVADRGHNNPTYGNWVYNTITMSAFGFDAYVKHMTSWEELKWHLANVGPVGASIKGNAILYTTEGHLIVVRGYRVVNGETYVICNDPNINERFGNDKNGEPNFVYYEFPLNTFIAFWRKTTYIIE